MEPTNCQTKVKVCIRLFESLRQKGASEDDGSGWRLAGLAGRGWEEGGYLYDGVRAVSQDNSLTAATLNDIPDLSPDHKLSLR